MSSITVLGFDFGSKRIGAAVGQTITKTATPLVTLQNIKSQPDWPGIARLIEQWQPNLILIGLPLMADGQLGSSGQAAKQFAEEMEQKFRIPVELHDERFSSVAAKSILQENPSGGKNKKNKQTLDEFAAAVIVQSWLNTQ